MKLTEHFTLEEFQRSTTATKYGIDNTVPQEYYENVLALAKLLETIRKYWDAPIIVTSGYRCPKLNEKVKGAKNSSHLYASAADIQCKKKEDNIKLWQLIRSLIDRKIIEVHQLIWEKGTKKNPDWMHISIQVSERPFHKNQILYIY